MKKRPSSGDSDGTRAPKPKRNTASNAASKRKAAAKPPRQTARAKRAEGAAETRRETPATPPGADAAARPADVRAQIAHAVGYETGAALPPNYGEDRLGVLVRDAKWVHCYWELEGGACQRIIDAYGKKYLDASKWVLRLTPSTAAAYDVAIDPTVRGWYLEVGDGLTCQIELGVVGPDEAYHPLVAGGTVATPPAAASARTDVAWANLQDEHTRLMEFVKGGASMMSLGSRGYLRALQSSRKALARGSLAKVAPGTVGGYLLVVLHAHLPYVRHPEYERFLEEDWLFEAITETYVPMADMFTRLADEGIRARAAITLTPPLCEMMSDPLLQRRYAAHLDRLIACADAAFEKMRGTPFHSAAEMYCQKLRHVRTVYYSWDRNLIHAFRSLEDRGALDILTCAATHGLLPLMRHPEAVRAQIEVACRNYEKHFGRPPQGIWLPECAYTPGLDRVVAESGLKYFFLDAHGLLNAAPQPRSLTYQPVMMPSGAVAFARDPETGVLVWSAEHGFPGDPIYREFYRDLGYDGDYDMVRPCLHSDGMRRNIGLKYHRVTGRVPLDQKEPYVPEWARKCTVAHADYFVTANELRIKRLDGLLEAKPLICAMYDAELFGHWWYEGIEFLEGVFRRAARPGSLVTTVAPEEYILSEKSLQVVVPSASSWGNKGYFEHWLNGANDWVYPHLHKAEERMLELARRFPDSDGQARRCLNQAARELLLAQASDWAFLMSTGTATPYAIRRTRDHVAQFTRLYEMLVTDRIDEQDLSGLEQRDAIFQEIDYRVYAGR
jgi:1,4-alpha-glucan branching enzyme